MPKLETGSIMPDFTYDTPFAKGLTLAQTVKAAPKTALVFLRYFGCTLCQLDLHRLAQQYDTVTANGGQVLVVLQSDPDGIAAQIGPDTFPFAIVCDPEQTLYRQFSIEAAPSKAQLADAKTLLKIAKATASGYKHGAYEGNELQLPAVFVMDAARKLSHVHYGSSAGDVPDPEQLAALLR